MRLTYLSHSCFLLEIGKFRVLTDPFLTGNPKAAVRAVDVECDFILVSHGHIDHCADVEEIARRNEALVIGVYELAEHFAHHGCRTHGLYTGGGWNFPFGRVKAVLAHHGSGLDGPDGTFLYLGQPVGYVITWEGRNFYFAGDTCVFLDMQVIARLHPLELALLPIGDNFTMGIDEAVLALEYLRPRRAVPMHYGTLPLIEVDPHDFARRGQALGVDVTVLEPGETLDLG